MLWGSWAVDFSPPPLEQSEYLRYTLLTAEGAANHIHILLIHVVGTAGVEGFTRPLPPL